MRFLTFICLWSCLIGSSFGQNTAYAQRIIDTLASPYFSGRGYVDDGGDRAAKFIHREMKNAGLKEVGYHKFSMSVNTFPEGLMVSTNERVLIPGMDYLVDPSSRSCDVSQTPLVWIDQSYFVSDASLRSLFKMAFFNHIVIVDTVPKNDSMVQRRNQFLQFAHGVALVEIKQDLTWSVAMEQSNRAQIWVLPGILNSSKTMSIKIDAVHLNKYKAKNIVGKIKGTEVPDSFIVITGHYDHLGRMGAETFMPGANDNASGIAMILDLVHFYVEHPPRYSIVFIAFAAEEAGLVGSYHFVKDLDHFIKKDHIRFLINMDLMGSGEQGIMAVNGKVFEPEFQLLDKINSEKNYLSVVKSRGKAANSDHYFFTEAGVRCFFFYLMGAYAYYHDVDDSSKNLRLSDVSYSSSFLLIKDFMNHLMAG